MTESEVEAFQASLKKQTRAVQPAVQDEEHRAILMNQILAVAPEQETQTPEAVQKSGSESSLNQSSKESFTAMQYRPLGLIKVNDFNTPLILFSYWAVKDNSMWIKSALISSFFSD